MKPIFPWGAIAILHGLCAALFGLYLAMALVEDGLVQAAAWGICAAASLLWVAAARVTLFRKSSDDGPGGLDLDLRSSRLVVSCLLGAWALLLISVTVWVVLLLTDFGALESPGFMVVAVVGALGSLPDLYRLASGRLHRWSVTTDASGLHYAGWRTRLEVPWKDVQQIASQDRPVGVLVRRKHGDPITLTVTPFDVTPEGLAERLRSARAAARSQ